MMWRFILFVKMRDRLYSYIFCSCKYLEESEKLFRKYATTLATFFCHIVHIIEFYFLMIESFHG